MLLALALLCQAKERFGVVVDAGSSSTKFTVFKWKETIGDIPAVDQIGDRGQINIKLAAAASDETVVPHLFSQIITEVSTRIPAKHISSTRFFVGATAGMRVLPLADQERVMEDVYFYLRIHSPYRLKRDYVRVLEGYEEGIYGWLSMCLLTDRFTSQLTNTTAFSDMGGSSMELVYETTEQQQHVHAVSVGSESFRVFSYCYDGYGADAVVDYIISKVNGSEHPCFLRGHNFTAAGNDYYGTGDVEACMDLINKTLIQVPEMSSVDYPDKSAITDVVGASFFSVMTGFLNLSTNATLAELKERMVEWSARNWDQVNGSYPDYPKVGNYMMLGWYCYQVLLYGYGFGDERKFLWLYKIGGRQVDWTLGALLAHIYDVRIDGVKRVSVTAIFWANVALCVMVIPVFIVYLRPWKKEWPVNALICP